MSTEKMDQHESKETERQPFRVRLPGFLIGDDTEVGLGDAAQRVTYAIGIKPCNACEKRAAALNRWMVFFSLIGCRRETHQKKRS